MQKYFSRYSSYVIGVFVFVLALSFAIEMSYSQEKNRKDGPKAKIGKKIIQRIRNIPRIRAAIEVQKKHTKNLMDIVDVVGTATGISPDGEPVVKIFTARAGIRGIPAALDGIAVKSEVTGRFYALQEPPPEPPPTAKWPRPVPIGVSTGHPSITAGTIGARVTDGSSIYALSNNHIYAAINTGNIGDNVLQPGTADGGISPDDAIGMLADFETMHFCQVFWIWLICPEVNTIDAAIADVVDSMYGPQVRTSTPSNGYGTPNAAIHAAYGTPDVIDDAAEDLTQLLGLSVQKYGRTTELTTGTIDAINATVDVCYDQACSQVARFVEQIIITPGTFSAGGDSGSLIVTNDASRHPVALLFAGSSTQTIANRIDRVLNRFGVTIDSGPSLSIDDVIVAEGDEDATEALFIVSLSDVSDYTVTVDYGTVDGDARTDDNDYIAASGTLTFLAGEVTKTITVIVNGDNADESDEYFYVYLSNPSNATIADHQAEGIILDNDGPPPPPPEIIIDDISIEEGDEGTTVTADFEVSLSAASSNTVTVDYYTADGDARTDDNDYIATSGTLTFLAGEVTKTITVIVNGDNEDESDEYFYVYLSNPSNATIADNQAEGIILSDDTASSGSPYLRTGKVWASTVSWTTVALDHDYGANMVVVCTPNYDENPFGSAKMPLVVHVQNASGNSFDIRIVQAVGGAFESSAAWVHWMVVEAGVYNETDHGVKMEAAKFNSTLTDRSGSWNGTNRTYAQPYINPVVVGQVMSLNSYDATFGFDLWSVFWCRGSSIRNPPSTNSLWVGKHAGEDPRLREPEFIGYVVIEAGSGSFGTTHYAAGLGTDSIRGVGNSPPYMYNVSGISDPSAAVAILSQAAMDGGDGGWAILYGDNPITLSGLRIAIDEDQAWNTERRHTTEQVGYIVFEAQTP
jgi:hypothetical protein